MSTHVFLSYPRVLDERGAVSDICAHLERELVIKTGERDLVVFQDITGIDGGDPWSRTIEAELDQAAVFIVFLCPAWLTSAWCVKELRRYREPLLGPHVDRPVLPLLWERTDQQGAFSREQTKLLAWINTLQAVDWRDLRHQDSSYKGYRRAISRLADAVAKKLSSAPKRKAPKSQSPASATGKGGVTMRPGSTSRVRKGVKPKSRRRARR